MVNIIKIRDQEEMTKYALAVVWGMFPTLESRVYLTGKWLLLYRDWLKSMHQVTSMLQAS